MKLSVVVPYYRAAETIGAQLEALSRQRAPDPWEVVVADNESSVELKGIVQRYSDQVPGLRIVDASDRRGPAHARNVGIRASAGEAIALCDADDVVGDGWLSAMHDALTVHDFVACRLDFQKLNPPWAQYLYRGQQEDRLRLTRYPPYLPFSGAGTLGFRRSVYVSAGGFDESWPIQEDKEFCIRVQLAGIELHLAPNAVIHFRCRSTLSGLFNQARSYGEYDIRLYRRYRPRGVRVSHPWLRYAQGWNLLIRNASQLRSQETRATWVWQLGWQIGKLQGSLRYFAPPV